MCEETEFIARSLDRFQACVPPGIETRFHYLKQQCFHMAPEIAHTHWNKIHAYLSNTFQDADVEWQDQLCDAYHEEYINYLKQFKHGK